MVIYSLLRVILRKPSYRHRWKLHTRYWYNIYNAHTLSVPTIHMYTHTLDVWPNAAKVLLSVLESVSNRCAIMNSRTRTQNKKKKIGEKTTLAHLAYIHRWVRVDVFVCVCGWVMSFAVLASMRKRVWSFVYIVFACVFNDDCCCFSVVTTQPRRRTHTCSHKDPSMTRLGVSVLACARVCIYYLQPYVMKCMVAHSGWTGNLAFQAIRPNRVFSHVYMYVLAWLCMCALRWLYVCI